MEKEKQSVVIYSNNHEKVTAKIFIDNEWTNALTFFCSVTYDDLSTSFACLLHRQRRTEALLVLPQALAFFEAVLLHDLMGHRTSEGQKKKLWDL